MRTIVDYDRGNYNDFMLRHRIFDAWCYRFFEPWYDSNHKHYATDKRVEDIDEEDENLYKIENGRVVNYTKLLNEFHKLRPYKE